jgi:hypothetical protein
MGALASIVPTKLVVRWVSNFLVKPVLKKTVELGCGRPVLIWVAHRAIGFAFASEGLSFYSTKGFDQNGLHISQDGGTTACVSINAISDGFHLADRWSDNIITSPPPQAAMNEQMLARTHRNGQKRDAVTGIYLTHTDVHRRSLGKAIEAAKANQHISGPQRLCMADWIAERD